MIEKKIIPVRLDKPTVDKVKKLCKETKLPFSTMLRVLIIEALRLRDEGKL